MEKIGIFFFFSLKKKQVTEDMTLVYRTMNDTKKVNWVLLLALS